MLKVINYSFGTIATKKSMHAIQSKELLAHAVRVSKLEVDLHSSIDRSVLESTAEIGFGVLLEDWLQQHASGVVLVVPGGERERGCGSCQA